MALHFDTERGMHGVLPIYRARKYQAHARESYRDCGEIAFRLINPKSRILPFQFKHPVSGSLFSITLRIYDASDDTIYRTLTWSTEIEPYITITPLADGLSEIVHVDIHTLNSDLADGRYYLRGESGVDFYSEVFEVRSGEEECTTAITINPSCNIENKLYAGSQTMYLLADVGRPLYRMTEEVVEDANKSQEVTFQRLEKYYTFKLFGPEYVCNFMSLLPMVDNATITNKNGEVFDIKRASVEVSWPDSGSCEADISVEFTVDESTKSGCCDQDLAYNCDLEDRATLDVVAIIGEQGNSYTSGTYYDHEISAAQTTSVGDLLLIKGDAGGPLLVYEYAGSATYRRRSDFEVDGLVIKCSNVDHDNDEPYYFIYLDSANKGGYDYGDSFLPLPYLKVIDNGSNFDHVVIGPQGFKIQHQGGGPNWADIGGPQQLGTGGMHVENTTNFVDPRSEGTPFRAKIYWGDCEMYAYELPDSFWYYTS